TRFIRDPEKPLAVGGPGFGIERMRSPRQWSGATLGWWPRQHDQAEVLVRADVTCELLAVGGPDRIVKWMRIAHQGEIAAVGPDGPGLIGAAAVGIEGNERAVGRPARHAVLGAAGGQLAEAGAIRMDHEEVLSRSGGVEKDPRSIRRRVDGIDLSRASGHRCRRTGHAAGPRIEVHALDVRLALVRGISEVTAVAREGEEPAPWSGCGDRFDIAEHLAGLLVDRDPPEVHRAAAIARKVEIPAVRRPDRVPVHVVVVGHPGGVAAGDRQRPDAAPAAGIHCPEGDALAGRRPARLDAVSLPELLLLVIRDANPPELAHALTTDRRIGDAFGGEDDLSAVRRPGRAVAECRQAPRGLAGSAHDEDTAALALGAEGDVLAVGGEGRMGVVRDRIGAQVPGIGTVDPLRVDMRPTCDRLG